MIRAAMESSARTIADGESNALFRAVEASFLLRDHGPGSYHRHSSMQFNSTFGKDSPLNGTDNIIRQLEQLASRIDRALTVLRGVTNQDSGAVAATSSGAAPQRKRRRMSAAARKRIGAAARRRWAAIRAVQESDKPATVKRRKHRLSPEGRQRIIEAAKRRWAAKRG